MSYGRMKIKVEACDFEGALPSAMHCPTARALCRKLGKQLGDVSVWLGCIINKPIPGAMALCDACKFRKDLGCTHPDLKSNGGTGLYIKFAEPVRGFWDGSDPKTGRRTGGSFERYPAPPSECKGQTL